MPSLRKETVNPAKVLRKAYASGLNVIPQGGKKPIVEWGQYREKRIPEERFERWLRKYSERDWAVVCGPVSGVIVLDVDDPDALGEELQPFVHTPSGGFHIWVRHPGFECRNGVLSPGLELKWTLTATFLGSGRELDPDRRILSWTELPSSLRRLIDARRETSYHIELPEEFTDYVPESELLSEALERVKEGTDGGRNNTGLWLASQLRDELQAKNNAAELAWEVMQRYVRRVRSGNGSEPYTDREAYDTLQSAFSRPPRAPRSLQDPSLFNREFKRQIASEKAREYRRALKLGPFDVETFAGVQEDLTELRYRVDKLQVDNSSILIAGRRKQGKTTVALNLAKSLIDGTLLFNRFPVEQIEGTVAYWNYEMSLRQFNVWLHQADIEDHLRFVHWPLRGKHVNLMNDDIFSFCVERLKEDETEYLFMDPWSRAIAGIAGENNNEEVRAYLERIDELKEKAGVPNLAILAHISPKSKDDMVRGASALEDWADAWWIVKRESMEATGRDIDDVEPFTFTYQKDKKHVQYDTTKSEHEIEWAILKAVDVLRADGGRLTTRQWEQLIRKEGVGGRISSRIIQTCRERGLVKWKQEGKQRIVHWTEGK